MNPCKTNDTFEYKVQNIHDTDFFHEKESHNNTNISLTGNFV